MPNQSLERLAQEMSRKYSGKQFSDLLQTRDFSRNSFLLFLESRKLEAGRRKLGEEFSLRLLVWRNSEYQDCVIKEISTYYEHIAITITPEEEYDAG